MSEKSIWIVYSLSRVMEDCLVALDGKKYLMGETFVPANTMQEAISQIEGFLLAKKLELVDIPKCLRYDPQDWQDDSIKAQQVNEFGVRALNEVGPKFSIFASTDGPDDEV